MHHSSRHITCSRPLRSYGFPSRGPRNLFISLISPLNLFKYLRCVEKAFQTKKDLQILATLQHQMTFHRVKDKSREINFTSSKSTLHIARSSSTFQPSSMQCKTVIAAVQAWKDSIPNLPATKQTSKFRCIVYQGKKWRSRGRRY